MPTAQDWEAFANSGGVIAQIAQQKAQLEQQAQLRAAVQQQLGVAQQNGNIDPTIAAAKQQELAQQDTAYQQYQQQQLAQQQQQQLAQMTPEQRASYDKANADNARYGTDLSWLDPSFQYQATQLGQSAGSTAAADPNAIAQQNAAMGRASELSNANLQFESPAQQQAMMQQWAQVQGGQGAPSFMGNSTQQGLMQQLLGVRAPQFSGDADQRAVLNQALGMATNSGPGSLTFDTSGRQGEQYGNLQGIIAGGGATAIEMADRARQRADSESWLRGQREADMADYAERGLTGSGMELLNLSSDRQAAAGRNSLADLETAKALEERRLGAINSAAGLATNMRGQTIDEQGLLNTRATSGLGAASSVANAMRSANIDEQEFLNTSGREQAMQAANIAGTMRGQDTTEKSYLDQRAINALTQQTGLATTMRNQTADEQVANRTAQQAALNTLASTSGQARGQSAQEAQYRATSADDFSQLNQAALNNAASANTQFLQNAYQSSQNNRVQTYLGELGVKAAGAQGLYNTEAGETKTGYTSGQNVADLTADQFNKMLKQYQDLMAGSTSAGINDTLNAGQNVADATGKIGAAAGKAVDTIATAVTGGAGGGGGIGALAGSEASLLSKDQEEKLRRSTLTGTGY